MCIVPSKARTSLQPDVNLPIRPHVSAKLVSNPCVKGQLRDKIFSRKWIDEMGLDSAGHRTFVHQKVWRNQHVKQFPNVFQKRLVLKSSPMFH